MPVQQDQILQMHQVAFDELARTGFMEEKALHPCRALRRTPRPLIEPADGLLRRQERSQHGFRLKFFNFVSHRIHEIIRLPCKANIPIA